MPAQYTSAEMLSLVRGQIRADLPCDIRHASMWLILDNNQDHWKNSVLALSVGGYADMKGLPRLEDSQMEGALLTWTKWIRDGFGLFVNNVNTARRYWGLSYREKKITQYVKVADIEMRIRQVEQMCHSVECRVGVGLPTNNRYYKVSTVVQTTTGDDPITQSDAYYKIFSERSA
jgi:hypothetical protein